MQYKIILIISTPKLLEVFLLSIGTDDFITNGERPWSSNLHQQMATEYR
jgi:hypothetical protein